MAMNLYLHCCCPHIYIYIETLETHFWNNMHCHCADPHLKNVDVAPLFHTINTKRFKKRDGCRGPGDDGFDSGGHWWYSLLCSFSFLKYIPGEKGLYTSDIIRLSNHFISMKKCLYATFLSVAEILATFVGAPFFPATRLYRLRCFCSSEKGDFGECRKQKVT